MVYHEVPWGALAAIYLFLGGLSAGAFIVSGLTLFYGKEGYKDIAKLGAYIAPFPLFVELAFLVFDLTQPLRFWTLLIRVNPLSVMSLGLWLLTLYSFVSVIYLGLWFIGDRRKKIAAAVDIPLAIGVATYTGLLLSVVKARALWNTPIMPVLFLNSAGATGLAIVCLFSIGRIKEEILHQLGKFSIVLIIAELCIIAAHMY